MEGRPKGGKGKRLSGQLVRCNRHPNQRSSYETHCKDDREMAPLERAFRDDIAQPEHKTGGKSRYYPHAASSGPSESKTAMAASKSVRFPAKALRSNSLRDSSTT